MKQILKKNFQNFKKEIRHFKLQYFLLAIILVMTLITRTYRIDQILGFYFDQGRDALQINKLLNGDLLLIGATTGLDGVFLGPFYYYFLAPGYLIGLGSPVIASFYQTSFVIVGMLIIFYILRTSFSFVAALSTLFLMAISYGKMLDDRWLSNPTPSNFFTPLTLLFGILSFKKPRIFLPITTFCIGIILQLEAATAFFMLILALIFTLLHKKTYGFKTIGLSLLTFSITLIPQLLFELKNNFLLTKNFFGFLRSNTYKAHEATFKIPDFPTLVQKNNLFSEAFYQKLNFDLNSYLSWTFFPLMLVFLFLTIIYWKKPLMKFLGFWFLGSLLLLCFYNGNHGRIYSYYFIPIIPLFFMYLGILIEYVWKKKFAKIVVILILSFITFSQAKLQYYYLISGVDGPTTVAMGNQREAVNYILNDGKGKNFNIDVYVPPVIPYAYDYLFQYRGNRTGIKQQTNQVGVLYTLHEVDLERPQRETDWLRRQDRIGKVIKSVRFGGIGVELRERIKK